MKEHQALHPSAAAGGWQLDLPLELLELLPLT